MRYDSMNVKDEMGELQNVDHSPPSSAEVENEWELYRLSHKRLHGV
jgi:hypothetical protein